MRFTDFILFISGYIWEHVCVTVALWNRLDICMYMCVCVSVWEGCMCTLMRLVVYDYKKKPSVRVLHFLYRKILQSSEMVFDILDHNKKKKWKLLMLSSFVGIDPRQKSNLNEKLWCLLWRKGKIVGTMASLFIPSDTVASA